MDPDRLAELRERIRRKGEAERYNRPWLLSEGGASARPSRARFIAIAIVLAILLFYLTE